MLFLGDTSLSLHNPVMDDHELRLHIVHDAIILEAVRTYSPELQKLGASVMKSMVQHMAA
jgi:hypothetical protein